MPAKPVYTFYRRRARLPSGRDRGRTPVPPARRDQGRAPDTSAVEDGAAEVNAIAPLIDDSAFPRANPAAKEATAAAGADR